MPLNEEINFRCGHGIPGCRLICFTGMDSIRASFIFSRVRALRNWIWFSRRDSRTFICLGSTFAKSLPLEIHIDSSANVEITESIVEDSELSNIVVDNSIDMTLSYSHVEGGESSGVIVSSGSLNFNMLHVVVEFNDDYGCLIASPNANIAQSYIKQNGLNGIYISSVHEVDLSENKFEGNGLSELKIIGSTDISIDYNYFNATELETESGGWGIDISSSSESEINHNIFVH